MFLDKLYKIIYETPLAYDDLDMSKIGSHDPITGTMWGALPPKDMKIPDLIKWVEEQTKEGVFIGEAGKGATRQAFFNDGKTVFKYNYSKNFGNQTKVEVQTYKKYSKKFSDVIPKTLKFGDNWVVQELAKKFTSKKFLEVTKLNRILPNVDGSILISTYFQTMDLVMSSLSLDEFDEYKNKSHVVFVELLNDKDSYAKKNYKPWMHILTNNENISQIVKFCVESGTDILDMRNDNLGFIGDRLVVIDYGFKKVGKK